MDGQLLLVALTGLVAGAVHVLIGPDHLAAVAPFTVTRKIRPWMVGLWWGIGHSSGVWTLGIVVFLLRSVLPIDLLSQWSERLVGVVLIAIGIWGIRKALNSRVHYHAHEHDGTGHAHFHVHNAHESHQHDTASAHAHAHAPLGIGLLHGLAGTSHILGVLPALALPTRAGAISYVTGFGLGAIFAMMCFSWVLGKLVRRLLRWSGDAFKWVQITFASTAVCVGISWLLLTAG